MFPLSFKRPNKSVILTYFKGQFAIFKGYFYSRRGKIKCCFKRFFDIVKEPCWLPANALICKAELGDINDSTIIVGTEDDDSTPLIWNRCDSPVPCSAIKEVHYWANGIDKDEIGMLLARHKYAGLYYPRPGTDRVWLFPQLWAEPVKKDEAEKLALFCGVKFVVRRG